MSTHSEYVRKTLERQMNYAGGGRPVIFEGRKWKVAGVEEDYAHLQTQLDGELVTCEVLFSTISISKEGRTVILVKEGEMLGHLTDTVTLEKQDGQKIEGIKADVQPKVIFIQDASLPIEEGDRIFRTLPNGLIECYLVEDRGYYPRTGGFEEHYQVKVRKETSIEQSQPPGIIGAPDAPSNVFIVASHKNPAQEAVSRFIEKLGFNAILLREQAHKGRTLIEKFEDYSNVVFAVVLLTPDDMGYPIGGSSKEAKPRPRQNVIFELGFFLGKLTRKRVCPLYQEGVDILSDYQGVGFIKYDASEAWRLALAKEMKAVDLPVDLNKAL